MPIRCQLDTKVQQVKSKVRADVEARMVMAADGLRAHVAAELDGGSLPIHSDTTALAKSLYVQSETASDYDKARGQAKVAYVTSASRWSQAVRAELDGRAYSPEHFDARCAPEEPLTAGQGSIKAAVATMLIYGLWWEYGHSNLFTKADEPARYWFTPTVHRWCAAYLTGYFSGLLQGR
jgi:hypothetical protein